MRQKSDSSTSNRIRRVPAFSRRVAFTLVLAFFCVISSHEARAQSFTRLQTILDEYPQRQLSVLEELAADDSLSPPARAAALLLTGGETDGLLEQIKAASLSLMDAAALMRLLFDDRTASQLTDETKSALNAELNEFFKLRAESLNEEDPPGSPESRELARLALLSMRSQTREDDSDDELRERLSEWLARRIEYGMEARGSAFRGVTLSFLLLLADGSADESIRLQATACLDMIAADWAHESLNGVWGGARLRTLDRLEPPPGDRIGFIWFGAEPAEDAIAPAMLHPAASGYRPPVSIIRIGAEREDRSAYDIKTRYFTRDGEETLEGRKYTYVDPSFILGSFCLRDQRVPWQSRPWELIVWDGESARNRIFAFAGDQLFSGSDGETGSYDLWNASVHQHRNVLFCRFHRNGRVSEGNERERFRQLPARLWIDQSLQPVEQLNGWWFCRIGGVFIAFRPIEGRSYWWRSAQSAGNRGEASILGFQDLDSAMLIEVENEDRFLSFEEFKRQVSHAPLIAEGQSVAFVSRRGDVFLFPLDDSEFLVNGFPVDPQSDREYQLYNSRFVYAEPGDGMFRAEWKPFSVSIDRSDPSAPIRVEKPDPEGDRASQPAVTFPYQPRR